MRQSSRKAVLEWRSGCCGEDQSHTGWDPPAQSSGSHCVCMRMFDLVSLYVYVCVCV